MDRDFFVKVVFGTHKVADLLPDKEAAKQMKECGNQLLGDLLLFCEANPVTIEQKRNILPRTLRKIDALQKNLMEAEGMGSGKVDPKNFFILQKECAKIPNILISFLEQQKPETLEYNFSMRQKKILELLKNKEKTQVWELQKVLPEVTKRTLRRDLDSLLALNLIERKGEWNNVFYVYKP